MIIVISTMTSGLTVANNVDESNAPIENYNTYVNVMLTFMLCKCYVNVNVMYM